MIINPFIHLSLDIHVYVFIIDIFIAYVIMGLQIDVYVRSSYDS